jgi:hypothetical protein
MEWRNRNNYWCTVHRQVVHHNDVFTALNHQWSLYIDREKKHTPDVRLYVRPSWRMIRPVLLDGMADEWRAARVPPISSGRLINLRRPWGCHPSWYIPLGVSRRARVVQYSNVETNDPSWAVTSRVCWNGWSQTHMAWMRQLTVDFSMRNRLWYKCYQFSRRSARYNPANIHQKCGTCVANSFVVVVTLIFPVCMVKCRVNPLLITVMAVTCSE